MYKTSSPNLSIYPVTWRVNQQDHLSIADVDVVDLANTYGTPLWLIDEQTIKECVAAVKAGLQDYPEWEVVYAGKAFLCSAMCHLINHLDIGLDVVSEGELYTAISNNFPANRLLLHGNNKRTNEIEMALSYGDVRIVVDSLSELKMVAGIAERSKKRARILLRLVPNVEVSTHPHISTGQSDSKFGISINQLDQILVYLEQHRTTLDLLGLHSHIGSGINELPPFLETAKIMCDLVFQLRKRNLTVSQLNLGGGVGIAFTNKDKPIGLYEWSKAVASATHDIFKEYRLKPPKLILEPGKSVVGTAGVTLYRIGHVKELDDGTRCAAVDGGMADNPRPITYEAEYQAVIANRMSGSTYKKTCTIVGKFCEQGDVLIKEAQISPETDDILAVFATGAYNYSQSSNYNRTGRPACLILSNGQAETIIERETNEDLLRHDQVPKRLQRA